MLKREIVSLTMIAQKIWSNMVMFWHGHGFSLRYKTLVFGKC